MIIGFGNSLGWFAFIALIPLIILYLIRPKPVSLKVPSLMFFIKRTNIDKASSFFRRFHSDLLFLLQLLAVVLLAFTITAPYFTLEKDVVSENIIFVLDVSASSQVVEDGKTRLDISKEKIKELASYKNSLIILKSSPIIALQDARRSELIRYLDKIQATDDVSDTASAIMLAGEMLANSKGRVVVVSDFIESKGVDADVAKNILESRGIGVDFIDVKKSKRENVGLVDMLISGEDVNLYIKNFNDVQKKISLKINDDLEEIDINPNAVEPLVFSLTNNLTIAEILEKDDFLVDNKVYITRPYPSEIKLLWITNRPSKFLKAALESIDGVQLTITEPPVVPDEDFDVYVVSGLETDKLAFGNLGLIYGKVKNQGKSAVVVAQKDSNAVNYENLLPIEFGKIVPGGIANVDQVNKFTKDIDFGLVSNIFEINSNINSIVSVQNETLISLFDLGEGVVVYYGILDEESDFKISPGYPIFWKNLIYSFVGKGDLNEVNLKTGFVFEVNGESKILDKIGVHQFGGKTIAVNLLNEKESDVNFLDSAGSIESTKGELQPIKTKVDYNLEIYLTALILIILLSEFIYAKYRGEL